MLDKSNSYKLILSSSAAVLKDLSDNFLRVGKGMRLYYKIVFEHVFSIKYEAQNLGSCQNFWRLPTLMSYNFMKYIDNGTTLVLASTFLPSAAEPKRCYIDYVFYPLAINVSTRFMLEIVCAQLFNSTSGCLRKCDSQAMFEKYRVR